MVRLGMIAAGITAVGGTLIGSHLLKESVNVEDMFWKDILYFQKNVLEKTNQSFHREPAGTKIFLKKVHEGVQIISKSYYMLDGKWEETTVSRTTPVTKIPPAVCKKLSYSEELDITDMLTTWLEAKQRKEKTNVWIAK